MDKCKEKIKTDDFLFRNILFVIIGVSIMAAGISLMRYAALGIDPYSCMNTGMARKLGLSFGTWQLISNTVLLAGVIIFDRKRIGFGTVYNMVATGYTSDFFLRFLSVVEFPNELAVAARIASLIAGIAILSFGAALYIEANMGVSPYDALAIMLTDKTRRSAWFRWYRIGTDGVCVIAGFLTRSDVGIGTLITACFAGPLMAFFREAVATLQKSRYAGKRRAGNEEENGPR
jgi:uncharacterized membrane protein YczE